MKYTEEQIETQVMKCIDNWDMKTLMQFAYEEMYQYYSNNVCDEELTEFMEEINYD